MKPHLARFFTLCAAACAALAGVPRSRLTISDTTLVPAFLSWSEGQPG